ncbi:MAG: putative DNA primase/helicase [Parasphingorhabdus sp.]|jgi:putative DNA primase/helicase|uniref:AAA family ATPase n=1 Tax=Parasphingorhabdus sp. TaxID=2709688 RepID=UPI0039E68C19
MNASHTTWDQIPGEMKALRQWAVCGPEYDKAAPKRPYNPLTKRPASPTDSLTWVTFEEASSSGVTAIGFMLTADDPFFVVDLDTYKSGAPQNHELLLGVVETYAERSLSGEGAHVIGMGVVGNGRNSRVHAIEIYDRARFIIMTGNRINDFGIVADQPFADKVMELLGPSTDAELRLYSESPLSDEKDDDLIARIGRAENGPKFAALLAGNIRLQNGKDANFYAFPDALTYESQSEADLALIEMLCFFTSDDKQVQRVFLTTALGQREKAHRRNYVPRSIAKARAMIASNSIPVLDLSELLARARSGETGKKDNAGRSEKPVGLILTRVSDVEAQEINWLWPSRIAEGKVTVIAGHPGLGKSQATAYLAAKVTTGGAWPNDEGNAPIGSVIMMSCEDDIADTIRPRLEAAGADVKKVHVIEGVNSKEGDRKVFSVKQDMPHLIEALDGIPDAKLVVIDPITAYLEGSDSHNTGDVRAALAPLQDLAMQRGIAVVVVSHLNKSGGQGRSVNAVTGSMAFVAASRATFLIEKDQKEPERRLFLQIKNNVADAPGLAFYVREKVLPNGIRAPYLEFQPGTVDMTADEALNQGGASGRAGSALDDAKLFLIEQLSEGPLPALEVVDRAKDEGIASKTLRNARVELGVATRKETGKNGRSIWSLPLSRMKANMP